MAYNVRVLLKKLSITNSVTGESLSYTASIHQVLRKLYDIQKRMSNYLTSFVMSGSTTYSIAGFFEFNKQENIIAMVIGMAMCMSLPLTRYEWFSDGSTSVEDEDNKNVTRLDIQKVVHWEERKYQAYYYFLNAVLVLMATNYALKSLDYSNYSEEYDLSIASSVLQPIVGVAYFLYKIYLSADEEDEE